MTRILGSIQFYHSLLRSGPQTTFRTPLESGVDKKEAEVGFLRLAYLSSN